MRGTLSTEEDLRKLLLANCPRSALRWLLEPTEAGVQSGPSAWRFSLHLDRLLQRGLTPTMLRLLIADGYLEQRLETTGKNATVRAFRPVQHLKLEDCCCFLLTGEGVAFVRSLLAATPAPGGELMDGTVVGVEVVRPRWSARPGLLRLGKLLVRRVRKNAKNVRQVLDTLEDDHWPAEGIDNPLSPTKEVSDVQRLTEVIDELNQHQGPAHIEFSLDDSKTRVLWRIL